MNNNNSAKYNKPIATNPTELSFIVRIHESEKYLKQCITSILKNSERNIEVIAIDDGSTDNSKTILNDLSNNYPNLHVIIHQDTIGEAATINKGLSLAVGKYITIVHAQDQIEDNFIEEMLVLGEIHNPSVIIGQTIESDAQIINEQKYITKIESFKANDKAAVMNDTSYKCKVFNKEFIDQNKIKVHESIINSSASFVLTAFAEAKKISVIAEKLYTKNTLKTNSPEEIFNFNTLENIIKTKRIERCILRSRGYKHLLNILDNFNVEKIFNFLPEGINKDTVFLKKLAKITRPYFKHLDLKKISHLTSTQKFILQSIVKQNKNDFVELSCIVPVYGAEKYLEQCLLSILENSKRNIEVIAINDGSPDNSREILDRLSIQYKNLHVIHQSNIGGAATINKGLDLAIGEYITIIDNDDWLEKGAIDIWLDNALKDDNIDIVSTPVIKKWIDKEEVAFDTKYIDKYEIFHSGSKPIIMNDGFYSGKILKREMLNFHKIRMDPTLLYADKPFITTAYCVANKICNIPSKLLNWRQREEGGSITDNINGLDNLIDRIRSLRILKFELISRNYQGWINTIDYFTVKRIFWSLGNKKYSTLRNFAKVTRPYFNEINLSKMNNLTKTQLFIIKSIINNSNEVFPLLYQKRIFLKKLNISHQLKIPFGISDVLTKLSNTTTKKIFNQSSQNTLKQYELSEDHDHQIIIFESNFGKIYGAQPKYIYEELLKQNKAFRAVWVYVGKNKHTNIPGNVLQVHRGSKEYFNYLARAGYWVNNIRFTVTYKPKNTIYLNTWHGTPLKKLGLDIDVDGPEAEARESFLKESRNWDYLLAQNSFAEKTLKRAFDVQGKVLSYGYPANEIFYKNNLKELSINIKKKLNIPSEKKVILYAPTWRDDAKIGDKWEYTFKIMMDFKKMEKELGDEYILLLRMHHLISDKLDLTSYTNFIFDVSKYDDTSEILAISDILITDYSSIFFDYASLKKPILFYMYDLEKYISKLRGFYLDEKKDLPGPIIKDFDQLLNTIKSINLVNNEYNERYSLFYKKYCSQQNANISKKVVDIVFKNLPKYTG